jgi:hypothetical protein
VRAFINAASTREIVFTRSATEALNLVAYAWGLDNLFHRKDDRIHAHALICFLALVTCGRQKRPDGWPTVAQP